MGYGKTYFILGSQIFEYRWDFNELLVEHHIDGDIINRQIPVSSHLAASAQNTASGT